MAALVDELSDKRTARRVAAITALTTALTRAYQPDRIRGVVETIIAHLLTSIRRSSSSDDYYELTGVCMRFALHQALGS